MIRLLNTDSKEYRRALFEAVKARLVQPVYGRRPPIYAEGYPYSRPIVAVSMDESSGVISAMDVYGFTVGSNRFFEASGGQIIPLP